MSRINLALRILGLVATGIVLTLFLYVASLGPAACMARHGMLPRGVMVMKVYEPLLPWAYYYDPYRRYLEWWVGPFEID
jgi:hypothetical protein